MAIAHNLVFGNVSARDYGIFISGEGAYDAPVRNVEFVTVPGRNGAIPIDKGSYDNITIEYPAFTFALTQAEFRKKLTDFKNAIMSQIGYQRLVDTYHPDEYRMAIYCEGLEVDPIYYSRAGSFTLKFTCKPQRYLTSGENEIEVNNGDVVNNPTLFDASPLLKIDGYGTVSFNGYEIEITQDTIDVPDELWTSQNKSYAKANESSTYPASFSISKTFDKTYFLDGDDITFNVNHQFNVRYYDSAPTITNSQNNASSTSSVSGIQALVKTAISGITFDVGTSSTWTNTTTIVEPSVSVTYTVTLTVAYNGNNKVTVTFARSASNSNFTGFYESLTVGAGTGQSTYVPSSNTMYLDCELGEAYSVNDGEIASLNGFVDLGSDLPKLASGNNTFALDNTITSLVLVPRWWKL